MKCRICKGQSLVRCLFCGLQSYPDREKTLYLNSVSIDSLIAGNVGTGCDSMDDLILKHREFAQRISRDQRDIKIIAKEYGLTPSIIKQLQRHEHIANRPDVVKTFRKYVSPPKIIYPPKSKPKPVERTFSGMIEVFEQMVQLLREAHEDLPDVELIVLAEQVLIEFNEESVTPEELIADLYGPAQDLYDSLSRDEWPKRSTMNLFNLLTQEAYDTYYYAIKKGLTVEKLYKELV